MKRRLLIMLTLAFLLAALCCTRALAEGGTFGSLTWELSDGKLTISGTGAMNGATAADYPWRKSLLSIKSIVIGDNVTSIGNSAFYNYTELESVTIGSSVTSIGNSAFRNCVSLASVTIPDSVTSIGTEAFFACNKLEGVMIPGSVKSIGNLAFHDCTSLASVTIGSGVTNIGTQAFHNCKELESVTIPGSVTSIETNAFGGCPRNMNIWFGGTEAGWDILGDYKPRGTLHAIAVAGAGRAEQPYKITKADHWDTLAKFVSDSYLDTAETHFRLDENISVSTMLGASGHPFSGVFDGNGKTLNVTISGSDSYTAPFRAISGATIKNLKVTGSVSGGIHSAGLVGGVSGSGTNGNRIENCEVAVSVTTSGSHCGGFLGHGGSAVTTLSGCVFSGTISGSNLKYAGTLWGWSDSATAIIENCLDISSCSHPIGRNDKTLSAKSSFKNVYYTYANKTVETKAPWKNASKRAYQVTAEEGVTIQFGSGEEYAVSGITACASGLLYNNDFLAGENDQVSLAITGGNAIEGTRLDYAASAGTLTAGSGGYTLAMPGTNVVIAAQNMISGIPYTGGTADCALVLANRSTWVSGWYVIRDDTAAQSRIQVTGNVNLILPDGKMLTAAKGIHVPEGSSLTVWAQSRGTGRLRITAPDESNAGIGGNKGERCGTVTIRGGVIQTQGGRFGAGIGGGDEGAGGTVAIHGGEVTASGRDGSAGIGGGDYASGGSVTITGGKITATGSVRSNTSQASAGIGAGRPRNDGKYVQLNGGSCTIRGGTVIAISGSSDPEKGAQAIGVSFKDAKMDANNAGTLSMECDYLVIASDSGNALPVLPAERMAACRGGYARIQVCGHSYKKNGTNTYVCEWCGSETDRLPAFGGADFALPSSLTEIGDYAFEEIALGIVEIPATCRSIGKGAFRNSLLRQIRIPAGCSVAEDAFEGCTGAVVFGPADAVKVSAAHGSCMFVEYGQ